MLPWCCLHRSAYCRLRDTMGQQTQGGTLDVRITLERATRVANSFNELIETWATLAAVWASKIDTSARESFRAAEVGAELSCRFTVRSSTLTRSLDEKDRVTCNGRTYNVTGVRETIGRHSFVEIDTVIRSDR
jgi:SPP1 family predicted phage head-tail adaptor